MGLSSHVYLRLKAVLEMGVTSRRPFSGLVSSVRSPVRRSFEDPLAHEPTSNLLHSFLFSKQKSTLEGKGTQQVGSWRTLFAERSPLTCNPKAMFEATVL